MDEVFDVQAALKDHPESEVAAHVAQLHGIDRDAYLKGGQTDAEFLSEFGSKTLPSATPTSVNLSPDALASRNDPLNSAGTGAILGGTASAGKIAFDRVFPGQPTTAAPELIPDYVPDPNGGQRYKAKTGYGAGEGETSKEVSDEWKRIQAEKTKGIGRGKISSRVTGGSPDEILARAKQEEAELADQARIRAEIRLKEEAQHKAAQATALEKKIAYEAEKKFHIPNAVGKMLPVAGATAGYNIQDAINQDNPVQKGIAAVGAAGSATPFIKKLPPKLRAIGVGASLLAPVINRGIDAIQDHAAGGSIQHLAVGGLDKLAKKGVSVVQKAAHELHGQTPGRMTDWLQHHPGKFVVPTQSDRMGGVGGPSFSANSIVLPQYKGKAWGSGNEGTATAITNLAKDERFGGPENQIFVPMLGHQNQHKSNQIAFDRLMKDFYEQPEKLTPELKAQINDFMRSGGGMEKATGQPYFSPFADFDIADRDMVGLLGRSFDNRGIIAQHGFGGERLGGKKAQIFPYQQRLDEMADPTVAGAPTFAVGPRAFQLTGDVHPEARPDLNAAFPYLLEGHDLNKAYKPVENSAIFQDFQNQWRQHKGKTEPLKSGKLPEPGYYENTIGYKVNPDDAERIYPRQEVTEQLLDSMYKKGYAAGGSIDHLAGGGVPEAVVKAYKLFKTKANKPGELYPLFVNATKSVPMGEWVKAEAGPLAASGKVKSKLGELANRPGWHAGDLPIATHIGGKSDPALKAPDFRRPDEVWAEVEMPNDVDWQSVANQRAALTKAGEVNPATAHITDQVPFGGHYRYKTNRNMEGNWLIGGDMKVNRVLSDEEVQAINDAAGKADLPRFTPFDEKADGGVIDSYAPGGKVGALEMLAKKLMPLAEREANKAKFLEGNHPMVPEVVYHAPITAPNGDAIDQMIGSKYGTLGSGMYTTPDTQFGSTYTGIPTPETIEKLKTSFPAMAKPFVKAMDEGDYSDVPMGGYMMPLHPSVKNPLILEGIHADPAFEALAKLGVPDSKIDSIVEKANEKYGSIGKEIQSRAQKLGHDGVILFKDGNLQEMVTYSPNQLKSAIGNEGTFNPYDPRLSKKRGGKVKK